MAKLEKDAKKLGKYAAIGGIATAAGVGIYYLMKKAKPPENGEPPGVWDEVASCELLVPYTPYPTGDWSQIAISEITIPYTPYPSGEWTEIATSSVIIPIGAPTYNLEVGVSPSDGGDVQISPDKPEYNLGDIVYLTAYPASYPFWLKYYEFSHWEGDVSFPMNNPTQLIMNRDRDVTAFFRLKGVWVGFTFYLSNFPPEWYSQYEGWYITYKGQDYGKYTPFSMPITIDTNKPEGAIEVYGKASPTYSFGDGCSYYYNWENNVVTLIYCP